jgi:hypothetical protein
MRRIVTWCLVGGIAALGLFVGLDALRDGGGPGPAAAAETEPTTTAVAEQPERTLVDARAELQAAGVAEGTLSYIDGDCRHHALTTPDLGESGTPGPGICRFRPVVGTLVESSGVTRSPDFSVKAECKDGRLSLWRDDFGRIEPPELYARVRGCGAAWMPDGTVTFIRRGEVRRLVRCPGDGRKAPLRCSRPVLRRADLMRQLRDPGWAGSDPRVTEAYWLDGDSLATIVRARRDGGSTDHLVLFERGRLVREPAAPYAELGGIRPSPSGRFVVAHETERGGFVVVDRQGEPVPLLLNYGSGIAWSPDERWIAEATEGGLYVFRADADSTEIVQIPVAARDVLWTEP